jgi:hypothetical protein
MRHFVRPKEDDGVSSPVLVKYVVISILALGCGFLSFNMQVSICFSTTFASFASLCSGKRAYLVRFDADRN